MEEDEGNALEEFSAELEEHLYAKIHHEQVESAPRAEAPRMAAGGGQKMGNGRYFGAGGASGKPWVKKISKKRTPILGIDKESPPVGGRPPAKKITLYESFLEGLRSTSDAAKGASPGNLRKNPARLFRKPHDVPPPAPPTTKQSPKRDRAKKNRRKDKKKTPTIVLDSSEDERDDDVVEVPVPPPPLVCLDSSDESEAPRKQPRRTASPSSSILSDDFIAAQDRRRLEALDVADEELRTVQRQSKSPGKRQAPLSDISTSDSEDFLPDGDAEEPKRLTRKRQKRPPTPKETPFILRGEALPNAVTKARKSIDTMSSHRSDEEFMTILNTIAIGDASNEPLEIPDSPNGESTDIVINIDNADEREATPEPENVLPEAESESEGSHNEVPESPEEIPQTPEEISQTPEEIPGSLEENDPPNLLHGWNEEMRRFYEESWGGEKFSVENIIGQMPDNNQWQISPRDFNFSRFHRTWREPQELKLVCYMCGDSGHREPRCPNTLCLRCGSRAMVFGFACGKCSDWSSGKCDICKTYGHKSELCPDLWRRYHATVEDVAPEVGEPVALNERKWCSICAKMGHTADSCPCPVRILEYPASPWKVSSYEAVYENADKASNPPDPFHTYRGERVRFLWSDNVQRAQFYGRFLSHCGVERSSEVAPVVEEPEVVPEAPSVIQKDNAESKIVLHRGYCKQLMSPRGQEFLKAMADEMCVEVNLRTSPAGNLLRLRGEKALLEEFRQRMMRFLADLSRERWRAVEDGKRVCLPVTRVKMIEKVKRNLARLQLYVGSVHELYGTMCSKANSKRVVNDARTRLNMILMGQVGLKEGRNHVRALEGQVAMLQRQQQIVDVPHAMRNTMNEHFRYIFSAVKHRNYPKMIRQFNNLLKTNKLPPMAIPRQDKGKMKSY